jgi:anti-sigma regulatory factor (Ser/Thr protein kinase)
VHRAEPGFDMSDEYADDLADDFSLVIPNTRSGAHFARIRFEAYMNACAVEAECANDIALAVGEALSNAAEHGHRPSGTLSIKARRVSEELHFERLEIEVTDDGHGFAPRPHAVAPEASGSRGFGIHIMRSLMDSVEFHDGGRRVVLIKRFRGT